jgi:hypothetical protein
LAARDADRTPDLTSVSDGCRTQQPPRTLPQRFNSARLATVTSAIASLNTDLAFSVNLFTQHVENRAEQFIVRDIVSWPRWWLAR